MQPAERNLNATSSDFPWNVIKQTEIFFQSSCTRFVILVTSWYYGEILTKLDSNPNKKSQLGYTHELELEL